MTSLRALCSCGSVALELTGSPITSVVCYCDDCQAGARQIEALANAPPFREADGGTAYVVYRKDRVQCLKGIAFLKGYKIRARSATNRVVATCCNSAMYLNFDDAKHWVDMYRMRLQGDIPSLEMRICTRFKTTKNDLPHDVPSYSAFPPRLIAKLVAARIAMLLRS